MLAPTALEIYNNIEKNKTMSFGCSYLNEVTGGLLRYGITEISGIAGSGKTQMCMVLALQCALSGCKTQDSVAYISCGEGNFPLKRFVELADHYAFAAQCAGTSTNNKISNITKDMLLQCVHIESCHTMEYIFEAIDSIIPNMCQKNEHGKIRLVIIDSIAGIVRTDYDTKTLEDMKKRTCMLFRLAAKLKWLSDTYNLAVVVVNQVTSAGFDNSNSAIFSININPSNAGGANAVVPSLGLCWTYCVNTRIMLHRDVSDILNSSCSNSNESMSNRQLTSNFVHNNQNGNGNSSNFHDSNNITAVSISNKQSCSTTNTKRGLYSKRKLQIVFSPTQPPQSCNFIITAEGVFGIPEI